MSSNENGLDLNLSDLWSMKQSTITEGAEDEEKKVDSKLRRKMKKKLIRM